jgi:hypothetical protein
LQTFCQESDLIFPICNRNVLYNINFMIHSAK